MGPLSSRAKSARLGFEPRVAHASGGWKYCGGRRETGCDSAALEEDASISAPVTCMPLDDEAPAWEPSMSARACAPRPRSNSNFGVILQRLVQKCGFVRSW